MTRLFYTQFDTSLFLWALGSVVKRIDLAASLVLLDSETVPSIILYSLFRAS